MRWSAWKGAWAATSIPRRILLQVAVGAGLVIAVATGATYGIVFQGAKQRDLQHLETYVRERALREEAGFRQVEANLRLVRGQFLKRMESPVPGNYQQKWDQRFRLFEDGAWRSREEFADGRRYATLWARKGIRLTPELQTAILRAQDICDELLPGWADAFPSVYFVMPGWANIGFDPRLPSWVWDTPADYDPGELEWFRLAMPGTNAPLGFSWTGVIEEPTAKVPIVSVYLPILQEGRFLGSIGHDLFVNRLVEETTRSGLTGAMHLIFRGDGRLIAHPTRLREILSSKGMLRMQDSGDAAMASLYQSVLKGDARQFSGYDALSGSYFSVARLAGPEWYFLTTMPRDRLQRMAYQSAQWVLWSGLVSLGLVLALLASALRRQVAEPLAELTRATRRMSEGDLLARAQVGRSDELGALAVAFNEMAGRVALREAELRHLNQDLELQVARRTSELSEANRSLERARGEAVLLLSKERELNELKSEFVALVSHEFRTPLEVILSSVENLERYHDRLTPGKREELLHSVQRSVRRMSGMMEEVLVLGRLETGRVLFEPACLDFRSLCQRWCDEVGSASGGRCPIRIQWNGTPEQARGDESLLRHIFTNLLSNAVKYSPPGADVEFVVHREDRCAVCRITDRGCGIPADDQKRLFQAFHRGRNVGQIPGTGLGLMIVRRCVDLHGGEIECESVEGRGTTFLVRLPVYMETAE